MAFDVLILGGGFAGLAAGVELASRKLRVLLLEKKPHLGGRAYSFKDPESGAVVDNGQHLFMGCYRETRRFLDTIGSSDKLRFSREVRVDFVDGSGRRDVLACPAFLGAPWHLAAGLLKLKGLSLKDKWSARRLDLAMRGLPRQGDMPEPLDRLTVRAWLDSIGVSRNVQERVLDPIALGALNDDPSVAAATGFAQVLREVFYRGIEETRLGLSSVGLSELYVEQAKAFIEARGGEVRLSQKVEGVEMGGVRLALGASLKARAIVSTLAPWELARLDLPSALKGPWMELKAAPIVSVCVWTDRPVIEEPLVGMIGTELQWVFNKSRLLGLDGPGQYLSLVISGAHKHVSWPPALLARIAERDLARCFPSFREGGATRWKVVKEPFATLSPVPGSEALRPGPVSPLPGFFFAGDWTRTGLPATIESAVLSGRRAAEAVLAAA